MLKAPHPELAFRPGQKSESRDFDSYESGLTSIRPRSRWCKVVLGFALALLALPVCGTLQFDIWIGFDGIIPQAGWFPITCEVFNDGPGFSGRFILVPDN